MIELFIVFIVAFLASFIGSMVGSGGLLTIPLLVLLGLPAEVAIATSKFGGVGINLGSIYEYAKNGKVVWRYVIPFSLLAISCGAVGASILISIDKGILASSVGIILLILLPLLFIKDYGIARKDTRRVDEWLGLVV